ncbi:helix-turn-helix domain-containing protein [Arhodomonas sp. AD133]|uniref:helix-turn-helix domain-containing protein n=1 Tax=Arhodomonas sp. AD133 TaxID=3415009 RepID=UPI003EC0623E
MLTLATRLRAIRQSTGMGRTRFGEYVGVPWRTIENIEQKGSTPRGDVLAAVAAKFPEYSVWLLTGTEQPEQRQTRPMAAADLEGPDSEAAAP